MCILHTHTHNTGLLNQSPGTTAIPRISEATVTNLNDNTSL